MRRRRRIYLSEGRQGQSVLVTNSVAIMVGFSVLSKETGVLTIET
jgi:hypothetical protein